MTRVLVVDDDSALRKAVARDLTSNGFEVETASSVDEALKALGTCSADILLTDLRMGDRDGIDLLNQVRAISSSTRPILMSAYATARDHQVAIELGAVRVLCKPFTPAELMQAINQAVECETGFRGSVHGLSLVDLLQMFHFAKRSICIEVGAPVVGSVHMERGEIVHASQGDSVGEPALQALLATPSGSITTKPHRPVEATITQSFQSLVLDLLRQLDEQGSSSGSNDPFDLEWPEEAPAPTSSAPPRLLAQLHRFGNAATVSLIDLDARSVSTLQGSPLPEEIGEVAICLSESVAKLTTDWTQFECVRNDVALSLIRCRDGNCIVLVADVLVGRYAQVKFRAQTGRIAALV